MVRRMRAVNDYTSTISAGINASVTSISVASATGLPSEGDFYLSIDEEIVLVTHISGTTLTVIRGQEDTTAANHSSGANIDGIATAGYFEKAANEQRGILALPYGRITRWDGSSLSHLTASNFTLYNTGTGTQVTDGNDGIITFQAKDMASNHITMAGRSFSSSSDWRIVAQVGMVAFEGTFDALHFLARDDVAGSTVGFEMRPYNFLNLSSRTSLTDVSPVGLRTQGLGGRLDFWAKLEIEWNTSGSDDTFRWYLSKDGVHWWLAYTDAFVANSQTVGIGVTNITGVIFERAHIFRWHEEALTF